MLSVCRCVAWSVSSALLVSLLIRCSGGSGDGGDSSEPYHPSTSTAYSLAGGEKPEILDEWQVIQGSNGWIHIFVLKHVEETCYDIWTGFDYPCPSYSLAHVVSKNGGSSWIQEGAYDVLTQFAEGKADGLTFAASAGSDGDISGAVRLMHASQDTNYYYMVLFRCRTDGTTVFKQVSGLADGLGNSEENMTPVAVDSDGPGVTLLQTSGGVYALRFDGSVTGEAAAMSGSVADQAGSLVRGAMATGPDGQKHVVFLDGARLFGIAEPLGNPPAFIQIDTDELTHDLYYSSLTDGRWSSPQQLRSTWLREHDLNGQGDGVSGTLPWVRDMMVDSDGLIHLLLAEFPQAEGIPFGKFLSPTGYLLHSTLAPSDGGLTVGDVSFVAGEDAGFVRGPDGKVGILARPIGKDGFPRPRLVECTEQGLGTIHTLPNDESGDAPWQAQSPKTFVWVDADHVGAAWADGGKLVYDNLPLAGETQADSLSQDPEHSWTGMGVAAVFDALLGGTSATSEVKWGFDSDGATPDVSTGPLQKTFDSPGFRRVASWFYGDNGEILVHEGTVEVADTVQGAWFERGPRIQTDVDAIYLTNSDAVFTVRAPATLVALQRMSNRYQEIGSFDVNTNATPGMAAEARLNGMEWCGEKRLCLRVDYDGFVAMDVSDPTNMKELGRSRLTTPGFYPLIADMAVGTKFIYGNDQMWLYKFDPEYYNASGPANLIDIASVGQAKLAIMQDKYLVVASLGRLVIMDGEVFPPTLVGEMTLTNFSNEPMVQVSGSHIYLFHGGAYLVDIDATDPTAPTIVRTLTLSYSYGADFDRVWVDGTTAWAQRFENTGLAEKPPALQLFDLTVDPPTEVARYWEPMRSHFGGSGFQMIEPNHFLYLASQYSNPPEYWPGAVMGQGCRVFREIWFHPGK